MARVGLLVALIVSGILFASCAEPPAAVVSASHVPTSPNPVLPSATDEPLRLNMDEIFTAGKGREQVLDNCLRCHSVTPIVLGSKTQQQWEGTRTRHTAWITNLSDEQLNTLFGYLAENYNPTKPKPSLPQWYLDLPIGTSSELP